MQQQKADMDALDSDLIHANIKTFTHRKSKQFSFDIEMYKLVREARQKTKLK